MKQLSTLIIFTVLALALNAQSISGTVKNMSNESIPAATVRLLKASDSLALQTVTANDNGKFQFSKVPDGSYLLSITAVGQKPFKGMNLTLDTLHKIITLPLIVMTPAKSNAMQEIVVTAKKPLVEQEIDKTVINVGSMISAASSNTLEVLEKTPGVVVNSSGDISLNGRGGVLVLIDGRSTYMSASDLAAYLKSIPGALLEKIELMDNPPARYDATGNAIINIRLKKNRAAGITGNISTGYSQGKYARTNNAIGLNYNRKKINLFVNAGYSSENNYNLVDMDRRFYDSENKMVSGILLNNYQLSRNHGFNGSLGLDYAASANTTLGFQFNLNQTRGNGISEYRSSGFNVQKLLDTIGTGTTLGKDSRNNIGSNLNFLHKFGKTGRELSADLNYSRYNTSGSQELQNFVYNPDQQLLNADEFLYLLPADFNIYTVKTDYVHPFKNKGRFETGVKSSIVDNNSIANYYDVTGNIQQIDYSKSNHFKYHENINAAYVNVQKTWNRFGTQAGLRVENTKSTGNQLGNDSVKASRFNLNYTQLFPSLFLSYKLDSVGSNNIVFSITRRINRPNYQYLNPFLFFRDKYSYSEGNPSLLPQYQYRYELRYTHKQWLRTALSYNRFVNVIFKTTENVNGIFVTRPQNVGRGYMLLLNAGLSLNPTKWWYFNYDLLLSNIGLNGTTYTEKLDVSSYIARINFNNQFKLGKTLSGEITAYYASSDLNGQAITKAMWRVNFGLQKKFWKDKASIRFSAEDVFHSWKYHNRSVSLKQAAFYQDSESDTQRFGLAFTYRFGKEDFARKRRHTDNASDEEKGRVQ